ncbi:MAG: hypothetical protein K2Z81_25265 [Cyanobacteria bacterium]|nr:hypothetical protein [Cyanobacteriota bacterium]
MAQALTLFLFLICLPVWAHEGTAGEHLILGLDTGMLIGMAIGFLAGIACTMLYFKNKSSSR